MLFRFFCFVALNKLDKMKLPQGILWCRRGFVRYLVHNVIKIIHRINDFTDIGFLKLNYCR
jgi:hypothetical protein